jgi:hypothetical protein
MATEDEKPIRIVDRRMFTAEGDLRPDFEPEEPAQPPRRSRLPAGAARRTAAPPAAAPPRAEETTAAPSPELPEEPREQGARRAQDRLRL